MSAETSIQILPGAGANLHAPAYRTEVEQPALVLFAHAGRTGGDTLNRVLARAYHPSQCFHFNVSAQAWRYLRNCPTESMNNLRCLRGHGIGFGLHQFCSVPCTYITMCRDPLKRVVSQYYSYLHDPTHGQHDYIVKNNISLLQYQATVPNEQTYYVLGHPHFFPQTPCQADLAQVFQNIEQHFSFTGITELYDESIFLLHRALGWKRFWFWTKTRENKQRPQVSELSQQETDAIIANNQLDFALYRYARDNFERQLRELSPEEQQRLAEYKESQGLYIQLRAEIDNNVDESFLHALLQSRRRTLMLVTDLDDFVKPLEAYAKVISCVPHREVRLETIRYHSEASLHEVLRSSQNQQLLATADDVVIATRPGQEHVARCALERVGIPDSSLSFALTP